MQAACYKIKLKTKNPQDIYKWFNEYQKRESEFKKSLQEEGLFVESVFLDKDDNGDLFLIYYMKGKDIQKAIDIFKKSTSDIDKFHQSNIDKYYKDPKILEKIFDIDRLKLED